MARSGTEQQLVRVLIADDEDFVRTAVADLLDDVPNMTVIGEASNGAEAIALVESLHPTVVLMDIRMPVMDGVEATSHITAHAPECAVLVHSAYGDESLVIEALQAGARGYVLKGSGASDLVSAVECVANGEAHISDEVTRPLVAKLVATLGRERQTRVAAQEAAELLSRVNARQQEFAIQAAHELRTPLSALLGALDMLAEAEDLEHEDRHYLARSAIEAVWRFTRLTDNLEVIATGDLLQTVTERVELSSVIDEVLRSLGDPAQAVQHHVAGLAVRGDPARLQQVIFNLVTNAIAASPTGSPITLRAEWRHDDMQIDVKDCGRGFEPELIKEFFQPFTHRKGSPSGLGVGLTVVRELVARMGGDVKVMNNYEAGATVRLTLPGVRS